MPVITLNKDRVLNLLGRKVNDDFLKKKISFIGTDLQEINDSEIIVEIFPNRPDLLSEEGFARALKTFLGFEKGLRKYKAKKENFKVVIDKSVSKVRPYTVCLVAKNLDITKDILDNIINIQEKLHVTFGRNRKKCAIGVYPLDNILFPVNYKALNPEEIVFVPLNETKKMNGFDLLKKTKAGKEYGFLLDNQKKFPVFLDSRKNVMSVPPILNSSTTGTVDLSTKNLFVECSGHNFNVLSKALNMIGAALADMGADIYCVELIYPDKVVFSPLFEPSNRDIDVSYINKYLGLALSSRELCVLLEKMGYGIKSKSDKKISVLIPCYRADILHPVDIVEDICISYGFDNFDAKKDSVHSVGKELFIEKFKEKIRDVLIGDGLFETMSYSIVKKSDQEALGLKELVVIKNPYTSEYDSMRYYLLPVVLKNFKNNKMNEYPQNVFEIGTVFKKGFKEENSLCVASCSDNASFTWAKQRIELIGALFDLKFSYEIKDFDFFIKGRSCEVKIKTETSWKSVGFLGELSLDVLRMFELEHGVSLLELNLDLICAVVEKKSEQN